MGIAKLDFNNIENVKSFLIQFMKKNKYKFKQPVDKTVGFNINNLNLSM